MSKKEIIKKYKSSSGITIVALVVTVLVLMILATISIFSLMGDDGTIQKTIDAKDNATAKQAKIEVNEEWYALQNETRKEQNDINTLKTELENRLKERLEEEGKEPAASVAYSESEEEKKFIVSYNGTNNIELPLDDIPTQADNDNVNITEDPQDVEVLEESPTTFSIAATAKGDVTYQWYHTTENNTYGGEKISGATDSTYTITKTNKSKDEGYYYCEVTSKYKGLTTKKKSSTGHLTIIKAIETLSVTPKNPIVPNGQTIRLEAIADEETGVTYQWYSYSGEDSTTAQPIQDATNKVFEKQNAQATDAINYFCKATQTYDGNTKTIESNHVHVTMNYLITLDNNGATTPGTESIDVLPGETLPDITTPTKDEFEFLGYFATTNGGKQYYDKDGKGVTVSDFNSNTTIYANWYDNTKPTITSITPSTTISTTSYIDFTAIDNGSGIDGYNITTTDQMPTDWQTVDGGPKNSLNQRVDNITENGTYYIWVKDVNGNVTSETTTINNIDKQEPLAEITATNDVSSAQTVTLTMGDNSELDEYYWGKTDPTNNNVEWEDFNNPTSSTNIVETKTVDDEGTYYLAVKDIAGNIKVISTVFYKTTLNPGSSSVNPSTIITMQNNNFDIPNPNEVTGNDFNGWYTATSNGTLVENPYTPLESKTLYAIFSASTYTVTFDPNGGIVDQTENSVTYGQTYGQLPTATREGYGFEGWKINSQGDFITSSTTVTTASNHTLVAIWNDTTIPTVVFGTNGNNNTPSNQASTTVTVIDSESGPKANTFKYLWTTRTTGISVETVETDFTGANSGTFTQGGTVTFPSNNSGDYYLYIYAEDNEGNAVVARSEKFVAGNMQPGAYISVTPRNDYEDPHPGWENPGGIITINPYAIKVEYDNNNVRSEIHDAERIASVTVDGNSAVYNNETGTYQYLATENKPTPGYNIVITDVYGNTYTIGQPINNVDNVPPSINVTDITYLQDLDIYISDSKSGVKAWQLSQSNTIPTSNWTVLQETQTSIHETLSNVNVGEWYVWAKDEAGNTSSKKVTVLKKSTGITISSPEVLTGGNSMTYTASISPSINGTWTITTSTDAVTITNGNNSTGASTTFEYTGKQSGGETTITVTFTPSDSNYDVVSTEYTQTVIPGNYSITRGSEKTYYNTMKDAVDSVGTNGTATIVQEYDYEDTSKVIISNGKRITFDNNGKTLTKKTNGIIINSGATAEITGNGIITTDEEINIVYIASGGRLDITHTGTISDTYVGTKRPIANYGVLNKSGSGTISSNTRYGVFANIGPNAVATISAGKLISENVGIHSYNGSRLYLQETVELIVNDAGYGILVGDDTNPGSTLEMTGGKITTDKNSAINVKPNSTATITGGTVSAGTVSTGVSGRGITVSGGTVNIGSTSNEFNTNNPVIQGNYGIYKADGTWNFYNGIIKGSYKIHSIGGEPTNVRSGYDVKTDTEGEYKTAYLKLIPSITVSASTSVKHSEEVTLPISYVGDGSLSATSANESTATARIEGNNLIIIGGNIGTTTITVSASEGENYLPKTAEVTVTVTNKEITYTDLTVPVTYDGQPHGISLSTTPSNVTIWYSTKMELTESNYNDTSTASGHPASSTTPPTITDVGEQTVYFYIYSEANSNYGGVAGSSKIKINKADIAPTVSIEDFTYGDNVPTPSIQGNAGNGNVTYYYNTSTTNGNSWTEVQNGTTTLNAGEYYLYATIVPTDNYNGATTELYKFTINKKSTELTISETELTIIAGNSNTFTIDSYDGDGTISVSSSDNNIVTVSENNRTVTVTTLTAGNITITVSASEGTNYNATSKTCNIIVQPALYEATAGSQRYHRTIKNAISAVTAGGTVRALSDTTETENVTINKNVIIDTNGKTITYTSGSIAVSSGNTTISGNGIINNIAQTGNEAIKVTGGAFTLSGTTQINSNISTIKAEGGNVTINGGQVTSTSGNAIANTSIGTVSITGGSISSTSSNSETISISGGNLNISAGTITSSNNTAIKQTNGSTIITGGTIQSTASNAIELTNGTMSSSGATINANSENGNGAYINGGTFNFNSGTINAGNNGIVAQSGTTNMGNSSNTLSITNPAVTAKNALYKPEDSDSTWNFYNGILKATENPYNEEPNAKRQYMMIEHSPEVIESITYDTAYLVEVHPTVTLSPSSGVTYINGYTLTSTITLEYAGGITVTSSNDNIATATASGIENNISTLTITPGDTEGVATITVEEDSENVTATYTVTVNPIATLASETVTEDAQGTFLGTTIKRNEIEEIRFVNSTEGHIVNGTTCFDVGTYENQVLAWVENIDSDQYVEIIIGQEGGVIANPNSSYLFSYIGYSNPATISTGNLDTTNVTNMSGLYYSCSALTSIDLSELDTTNVTDMSKMFEKCSGLTSQYVNTLNTELVTNMNSMFSECTSLTEINLSTFVTTEVTDMRKMFYECSSLVTINVNRLNFNTDNVTQSTDMFTGDVSIDGGAGTTYNSGITDKTYARIDGTNSLPGYFHGTPLTATPNPITMVKGNTQNVTLSAEDMGTISKKSVSNSSIADATINGSTATITASEVGTTNIVFEESNSNRTVTVEVTVLDAIYSVNSGSPTYHNNLQSAADAVQNNGTITTLKNNTVTGTVNFTRNGDKNITFNTNGKTITVSGSLSYSNASNWRTLKINGTGIINKTNKGTLLVVGKNATIATEGTPRIQKNFTPSGSQTNTDDIYGYVIDIKDGSANISLQGGYIYSTKSTPIHINDNTQTYTINNTYVVTLGDCPAIKLVSPDISANRATFNIKGTSFISEGVNNIYGDYGNNRDTLRLDARSNINLSEEARIYAGKNGVCCLCCKQAATIKITGNNCNVSLNAGFGATSGDFAYNPACIKIYTSGSSVTVNTTGALYSAGRYSIQSFGDTTDYSLSISKGKFKSRANRYMIYKKGNVYKGTNDIYVAPDSTGKANFWYCDTYNNTTYVERSGCYTKNINI